MQRCVYLIWNLIKALISVCEYYTSIVQYQDFFIEIEKNKWGVYFQKGISTFFFLWEIEKKKKVLQNF